MLGFNDTLTLVGQTDFSYHTFDLQVTLILPMKFQVSWPFGSGQKKFKIDFQHSCLGDYLGFTIGMILEIFYLNVTLILPIKS